MWAALATFISSVRQIGRRLPGSFRFLLAALIVFLLQLIPLNAGIMMMVGAIFWSVLLVNLGMIGLAVEAVTRRASLLWLVVPVAFYGGYWWFASAERHVVQTLTAANDDANAAAAVRFDPGKQALVFEEPPGWRSFMREGPLQYVLPVEYFASAHVPEGYVSRRLVSTEVCREIYRSKTSHRLPVSIEFRNDGDRYCIVEMPEVPGLPAMRVSLNEDEVHEGLLPVTRRTIRLMAPDGTRSTLSAGTASQLYWLPLPLAGCFLNSAAPSWDCEVGFVRSSVPIISGTSADYREVDLLAHVLGLKPAASVDTATADAIVRERLAELERGAGVAK